jgi:hypothetical protein
MSGKPDKLDQALTFLAERKASIQKITDEIVDESIKYREIIEELRAVRLENKQLKLELAKLKKIKK